MRRDLDGPRRSIDDAAASKVGRVDGCLQSQGVVSRAVALDAVVGGVEGFDLRRGDAHGGRKLCHVIFLRGANRHIVLDDTLAARRGRDLVGPAHHVELNKTVSAAHERVGQGGEAVPVGVQRGQGVSQLVPDFHRGRCQHVPGFIGNERLIAGHRGHEGVL